MTTKHITAAALAFGTIGVGFGAYATLQSTPVSANLAKTKAAIMAATGRSPERLVDIGGGLTGTMIGNEAVVVSPDGTLVVVGNIRYVGRSLDGGSPTPAAVSTNASAGAPSMGRGEEPKAASVDTVIGALSGSEPANLHPAANIRPTDAPTAGTEEAQSRAVIVQMLEASLASATGEDAAAIRASLASYKRSLPAVDVEQWLKRQDQAADATADNAGGMVPTTPLSQLKFEGVSRNAGFKQEVLLGGAPILEELTVQVDGDSKAPVTLTAFVDPLCPGCKVFHEEVQPYVAAGVVRVVYAPVAGVGGENSLNLGGALLTMGNVHAGPDKITEAAVAKMDRTVLADNLLGVQRNTEALSMIRHGNLPTPTILYSVKGRENALQVNEGYPTLAALLRDAGVSEASMKLVAAKPIRPEVASARKGS